ncbi:hypothetical protein SAMN05444410_104207 [Hydrobacter penzbergensis]|uniref:Uncharacterized protein n=1 Tax=Hydrobacter penzbergensis TaxID=1235997 RepID=A0A8X8IFC0_9BACT|nr:hypothetical protein SAMN05444410_104207 [Hydrobacter penzbergensis]
MRLIFPFRNITINTILDFFEKKKLNEFNDIKSGKNTWQEEFFNNALCY